MHTWKEGIFGATPVSLGRGGSSRRRGSSRSSRSVPKPTVPVPCFLLFFRFRNPTWKLSSESDEIFSSINKRSGSFRSPKGTWGGAPGPHTIGGRGLGWGRAELWRGGPTRPPVPIFRLYIPLDAKTLIRRLIFQEKFRHSCHRQSQIGGVLKLFPAPCRRGDHHRRPLHRHACLRSDA